ncbi:hypothetical protein MYX06_02245 [Patescibacteria group bacterium AH-259-L05]|nr:hypothetical protein [Patescibacteria group bacterium AH-259-L05]
MAQPLIPWDSEETDHPTLIWRAKFDDRYLAEVHRTGNYIGTLYVFDHNKNDKEIASWDVSLAYGAQFGPDAADVYEWQEEVTDFIDNTYEQ